MTFLGIDLGTSSLKLALLDAAGNSVGSAKADCPMLGTEEGRYEQAPTDWIAALKQAVAALRQAVGDDLDQLAGIGLSAQMPTMVILSRDEKPFRNAVLWCDARAEGEGEALRELWKETDYYQRTGIVLDGRYIIPMYLWARNYWKEGFPAEPLALSAKDFLCGYLTGNYVTDPSTASGYGVYSLQKSGWDLDLCRLAGIDVSCLPPVVPAEEFCGHLKEETAAALGISAGVPVCAGAADAMAGVFGMGGQPGTVCLICGSSTSIVAVSEKPLLSPETRYFITPLALSGTYGLEADLLATGASSAWLSGLLQKEPRELSRLAAAVPAGADGVLFFPYLSDGEQGVLWDASLTGGIAGLSVRHGVCHIARAHFEGICFEIRRCLAAFSESGYETKRVLCAGPVSGDDFFMQMLADVLGQTCIASGAENASPKGAALLAGFAAGAYTQEDCTRFSEEGCRNFVPNLQDHVLYERYYERYLKMSCHAKIQDELIGEE